MLFPRVLLLLSLVVPVFAVHARDVEAKRKLAAAGQALGKALAMHRSGGTRKTVVAADDRSSTILTTPC
ncbi:MAG: hypothetical protein JWM43_46 [Acidobacteriaceae bacterium]|nr:hypothetical protein [Acidobacteriaceae bacterium]